MNFNVLTTTLTNFINAFTNGWNNIFPAVEWLTGSLLAIELVLVGLFWALGGGEKLAAVFRKIIFLGFWLWIVWNFPSLCHAFVQSLIQAGTIAGGGAAPSLLDPSRIAGYGITATAPLATKLENIGFGLVDAIVIGWGYLLIMLAFLIIAWQVFYAVLEYYLLVAIVGILLPFGFLQQTKFLAEKAVGAIIASGIKLMVLAFILSIAEPILSNLTFTNADITYNELFAMLLTAGAIAFLAWNAPSVAAGLLAGAPSLSAGVGTQNAMAAAMLTGMAAQPLVSSVRKAAGAVGNRAAANLSGPSGGGVSGVASQLSSAAGNSQSSAVTKLPPNWSSMYMKHKK
ncbi:P-type conjugative transfer protein TrbL [uncultured Desulfobacterium sp.]|uniref:P-type conjugative transfer protein TrbL n=1 Tax=uncultured Desulfobacterium sp. TaxID=201089 RepID=A0A445MSN9_9BACT|nr:P-type conjugative transfer protein TrbL [uncultured Desulfobacterium sp.]